ncbi:Protein implicated in RNA metabolism, contains PRC-barrel domain [Halalkaliarchaeum sp. AArc-CO]|uniref:PRC-barrel domain-containing protein n=1 Tax=unclassified Halalkaliarchaeum TaxID=2678344 RepID=UPI00217F08B3|nr:MULTISPECIES: PRC-barrel domain-containing protein [unclassified Halalkaliarchaeum]MDR5673260.1 PRC-barrel domain-containing protein [Halalkaliarchaeum sp. AArc-GB]UWG51780.1 Protein implicated in RNA metabolism, contains PRC-barrel domain [Halalkaliarchaeum sp. AArc-CO]
MNGDSQEITTLVGREVYSNNGVFVGEIEDVRLNLDQEVVTGLAVGEINRELFSTQVDPGKGVLVPYRWVRSVGDVVLVNDVVERMKTDDDSSEDEEVVA